MALAGIKYGAEKGIDQAVEDYEAGGLNFKHRAAAVELVDAQALYFLQIGPAAELFDEGLVGGAAQDGGDVLREQADQLVHQLADEADADVAQLFAPVVPLHAALAAGRVVEYLFEQRPAGFRGDEAQLEAVFEVNDAVVKVVGDFDQKGQRVAVVETVGSVFGQ